MAEKTSRMVKNKIYRADQRQVTVQSLFLAEGGLCKGELCKDYQGTAAVGLREQKY